jgi:hypothetical protein
MSISVQQQSGGWVPIDEQTITGTVFTSKPWTPGTFRFLRLSIRTGGSGAVTSPSITLTGLTGTYAHRYIYTQGAGAPTRDSSAPWNFSLDVNSWVDLEFDIRTGGPRTMKGFNRSDGSGSEIGQFIIGNNDDTAHAVTGMVVTAGASGTFTATLEGRY